MNHQTNFITSILFDIRLSFVIRCPENQPKTCSSYFPTILCSIVLIRGSWGSALPKQDMPQFFSALCVTNSLTHNRMPEWTRILILHSQTSVSSNSVSLEKFKCKSWLKKKSRDTASCLWNKINKIVLQRTSLTNKIQPLKAMKSEREGLQMWEVITEQSKLNMLGRKRDENKTKQKILFGGFRRLNS